MTKKAQVTRSVHTLPFDKLSPDDFERLSLWLVMREGFQQVEHLGATGADRGQDIRAKLDNQLWVFQCKRVKTFTAKMAIAEIEKMLAISMEQFPNVYVFVTSCDLSLEARDVITKFAAAKFECRFWCATELDSMVKHHPDISAEFFAAPLLDITHFLAVPNRIPSLTSSPFSLHFSERRSRFLGRDNELDRLRIFAEDAAPLRWWAVTGAAGSGKSRLALEFILRLPQGWLGGFLVDPNSTFSWNTWKPIQPTLVVIDYASVLGERLPALLFDCLHTSTTYTQSVRFLLLERSVTSVWWDGLHRFGPTRSAVVRARFDESPLHLETPSNDALFEIVRGATQGAPFSQGKANSLRRLFQSAAKPTPLHCQLLGMSENSEGRSQVQLVTEAMDREYARWRSLGVDLQHRSVCALATILSGLSSKQLSRVLDTTSSIDPNIYAEMTGSYPKTELVPLEPDIFGESFVLDEIEDRNVWSNSSDLLNAAWNLEPSKTTAFAIRCVMDFPEHPAIRQLLNRERVPVEHVAWWVRLAIGCLFAYRGRSISFEEWRRIYNEIAAELSTSSLQTTDHRPMELFLRKGFTFYCVRNERLLEAREALDTLLEMQIDVNSREAVEKTQIESITILLGSASFQDLKYAERMHLTIRRIASRAPPFATDICDAMKVLAWQMIRSGRLADAMAIVEEVEAIVDRDAEDLGTRRVHGELTEMMIDEYGKLGDLKSAAARLEAHFDNRATGPLRVDEQNVRSLQVATINGIPSIILVSCALCRQYALSRQWDLAVTEFRRAKSLAGINNFRSYCGILGELLLSLVCTSREQLQLAYAVTLLNEFMEGDLHHEEGEWVAESVTALLFGLCDEAEKQEKRGVQDVLRLDAMVISLYDQMPANYVIAWSRARCAGRLATFMGEIIGDTIAALSYLETAARLGEELEADPRFLESVRTLQVMYGKAEKV